MNKKECALCHYTQSVIFLGASWFTLVRIHFIRKELSFGKKVIGLFASLALGSYGFHKADYANKISNNQFYYLKYIKNKSN